MHSFCQSAAVPGAVLLCTGKGDRWAAFWKQHCHRLLLSAEKTDKVYSIGKSNSTDQQYKAFYTHTHTHTFIIRVKEMTQRLRTSISRSILLVSKGTCMKERHINSSNSFKYTCSHKFKKPLKTFS